MLILTAFRINWCFVLTQSQKGISLSLTEHLFQTFIKNRYFQVSPYNPLFCGFGFSSLCGIPAYSSLPEHFKLLPTNLHKQDQCLQRGQENTTSVTPVIQTELI